MRARWVALLLLVAASCSKRREEPQALLAEARKRLAEREGRLKSYLLAGTLSEQGQAVEFQFAWRSPKWMLGRIGAPTARTLAWDGERLYDQLDGDKRFTTFRSELPAPKLAGFLTQVFNPFTPEGFRAPLLPAQGVEARRGSHARASEALELVVRPEPGLEVAYVLRWPALDFLSKRTRSGEQSAEVRVEEEQCDEALALCVPRRLTHWAQGQQVGETVLARVELNPTLPAETFTLQPPQGYQAQEQTLVESGPREAQP
jgi:hypothetical protein